MIQAIKKLFGFENKGSSNAAIKTILAVDDNEVDRRVIKSILDKKYNVITANDGKEGLEMIREHKPDLIVLDCEMPVMTGNEMCKIMKDDNDLKEIPVLFLTSINTPNNIIECFELDAENHLSKPVNSKVLISQVDAVLFGHETT